MTKSTHIDDRLDDLERRVRALEDREDGTPPDEPARTEQETFWALDGLKREIEDENGAVMMVGSVRMPNGQRADWQFAALTDDLCAQEFDEFAEGLSAIAHPIRLRLLQRLLTDAQTVNDLLDSGDFGTSGQIYHHLRPLVSAGWLRQTSRGHYEVPAHRIVPLLTTFLAVRR